MWEPWGPSGSSEEKWLVGAEMPQRQLTSRDLLCGVQKGKREAWLEYGELRIDVVMGYILFPHPKLC